DIAFAPEQLNGAIAVVDAQNTVVKSFPFRPEYRWREGVFGKAQLVGPADIQLTEPGVYNIVALIDGKPVSRIPVGLEQTSAGDDPFDPVKTFRYYGLWAVSAHLTMRESGDTKIPELTFWAGGKDLPNGARGDGFVARLYRDEQLIGNSRRTTGHIPAGHYQRLKTFINEVHEPGEEVNAKPLTIDTWTQDGQYTLTVARKKDDQLIRRFRFTVANGEFVPMANTQLGYEPGVDYKAPRATRKGANRYEFVEVIWIDGK
ncbi:MAG: hypothetical protein AAGA95_07195, partial [Pseudomonadota bacterium]